MGTRCITNVISEDGETYVSLYRQYDGYPEGHGKELAGWLEGAVIGNGISMGEVRPKFFNGVGDLALRMVTYFKGDHSQSGGFYIVPLDKMWDASYVYTIEAENGYGREGSVSVQVKTYSTEIFSGTVEEFIAWIAVGADSE